MKLIRRFAGQSFAYILGSFLSKGISVLLLPLYIRHLSPADYGILAISSAVTIFLGLVWSFSFEAAVVVFFFQLEKEEYVVFLKSAWLWLLIVPLCLATIAIVSGPFIMPHITPSVPWDPYLKLSVWITYCSIGQSFCLALLRARQKQYSYIFFTLASMVVSAALMIYLVVFKGLGALGALQGQLIGGIITAFCSHWIVLRYCRPWQRPWFSKRQLLITLAFCVPYLPHLLSGWGLNYSDRWILGRYVPLGEVGVYNLAYTAGMIVLMVGQGLMTAFGPLFYENIKQKSSQISIFQLTEACVMILTVVALSISLMSGELIRLIASPAFSRTAVLVPLIALAYWILSAVHQPHLMLIDYHRKSRWAILITGPAFAINLALNFCLVPRYGVLAAAITSVIGFAVQATLSVYLSRRLGPLPFCWLLIVQTLLIATVTCCLGNLFLSFSNIILALAAKSILLAIAISLMVYLSSFRMINFRYFIQDWRRPKPA